MLTKEHTKEGISNAYTIAIAHKAGCNISKSEFDYGIDGTFGDIKIRKENGKTRRYESGFYLDYQLKATETATINDTHIVYDLEVKNYNDLVTTEIGAPRILVLYLFPQEEHDWININNNTTVLKNCAWWHCLTGNEPTSNTSTKHIEIPISQVLTPVALRDLMDKIKRGEDIAK